MTQILSSASLARCFTFQLIPLILILARLGRCSAIECADDEYSYTEPDEPEQSIQGSEVLHGVCLTKNEDRFHITHLQPQQTRHKGHLGSSLDEEGAPPPPSHLYLLATDLCAMGHTTKDPAHFLSFLLDYFSVSDQRIDMSLHVVYGNACMARPGGPGGNKRTGVFHSVLLGWFRAIFSVGSPLHRALLDMGAALRPGDTVLSKQNSSKELFVQEHYFHHMPHRYCGEPGDSSSGSLTVVKRFERWRWFRTRRHAAVFRACLLVHYGVKVKDVLLTRTSKPAPNPHIGAEDELLWPSSGSQSESRIRNVTSLSELGLAPLRVLILRRDEDRHFGEENVRRLFARSLSQRQVEVELVTFDNIRGSRGKAPPSFPQQLEILSSADVFIAAHGAGLSSMIAMRPGSVVVELFPSNFRYYMYQELAQLLSLKYMAVESDRVWPVGCCRGGGKDPLVPLDYPSHMNGVGARACKKCNVRLTVAQLQGILRSALGHVMLGRPWPQLDEDGPFVFD